MSGTTEGSMAEAVTEKGDMDIEVSAVNVGREIAFLSDPDRMEKIFAHLSGGGTLIDYCKLGGVSYPSMMVWINSDKRRVEKYEAGKRAREDWLFERVLEEYTALSTLNLSDLYNDDGALKPASEWGKLGACIAGVESMEVMEMVQGERIPVGTMKKVKLYDKTKTLDALGRYLKMFREQIDVTFGGQVSLVSALEDAEKRARVVSASASPVIEAEVVSGATAGAEEPI